MKKYVAIIQPSVPNYRLPFVKLLISEAELDNIEIDFFSGELSNNQELLNENSLATEVKNLPTKQFKFCGKQFIKKDLSQIKQKYDLVIVEQAIKNIETYQLLINRKPVAFWGHGKTYVLRHSRVEYFLKKILTLKGKWFFAYTRAGADYLKNLGFDPTHITTLQNSTDTKEFQQQLESIQPTEITNFKSSLGIVKAKVGLYIGKLDGSKRLDFLVESAIKVHQKDPKFHLIIAGDGVDRDIVINYAENYHFIHYIGRLDGHKKALAFKAADAIMIPGAIGLVAVDALAAGLPVLTVEYDFHGPEFEYLQNDKTAVVSSNSLDSFADSVTNFFADSNTELRKKMSRECLEESKNYSIEKMAANFLEGLKNALLL